MSSEKQSFLLYCANKPNKELLPYKFYAALQICRRARCYTLNETN